MPSLTILHTAYLALVNTKSASKDCTCFGRGTNEPHQIWGKFGVPVAKSSRSRPVNKFVSFILFVSRPAQMVWVHTRAISAGMSGFMSRCWLWAVPFDADVNVSGLSSIMLKSSVAINAAKWPHKATLRPNFPIFLNPPKAFSIECRSGKRITMGSPPLIVSGTKSTRSGGLLAFINRAYFKRFHWCGSKIGVLDNVMDMFSRGNR